MCIEGVVSDDYEIYETTKTFSDSSQWNGRIVSSESSGTLQIRTGQIVSRIRNCAAKVWGNIDSYFNTNHDVCPRGHEARHIYYQWPSPPILLCDEQYDRQLQAPCPFEYYRFVRHLHQGRAFTNL
ncbi:MAG: hypothetical protein KGR16_00015 [Verrucomicrobia bacterium]|nr:hypothetical protein [Verrucomicrobiota bacterium]